jgi:hypothetical protein
MAGFYQNKAIMYCRRDAVKEYTGESHLSTALHLVDIALLVYMG